MCMQPETGVIERRPPGRAGLRFYRPTVRHRLMIVFSCVTTLPFLIFGFIYTRLGTFNTALSWGLVALALILVLQGFIIFRKMTEHIERLSSAMTQADTGKMQRVRDAGEARELAVIAETFSRTLTKLEETARELGVKALKAETLNEIREIVSKTIQMEEVASLILERAMRAVNAQAGYLAVKENAPMVLQIVAASGGAGNLPEKIELDHEKSLAGLAFSRKLPVIIEDIDQDEQLKRLNKPDIGLSRLLLLSVAGKDTPIGVLVLGKDKKEACFDEEDLQFLQTLLHQVAYSFENARLYQNLQQSKRELELALEAQKKTHDQLLASARMAAFGELSVNIAHELNNPLTVILGYADLLLNSSAIDEQTRPRLEMVQSQSLRASKITKSLLDFVGFKKGAAVRTDINGLVGKALHLVKGRMSDYGIRLDLDLAKRLPAVMVEPSSMEQVFFSLINNALNAMTGEYGRTACGDGKSLKADKKDLTLGIRTGKKNGKIYVFFQNNGPGIPQENLSRIFEPFYSTQEKDTQVVLGLWVSRRIVRAHGGEIQVTSRPEKGSTFVVILPESA